MVAIKKGSFHGQREGDGERGKLGDLNGATEMAIKASSVDGCEGDLLHRCEKGFSERAVSDFQILKFLPVQKFPNLIRLGPPSHAFPRLSRLPSAKRATRETADRLARFPPASLQRALRRARRHAFENTD
ncbi:hypothetical protein L3X38_011717 [Prunus dulcis]|uniref:Uncharacterized protein n=1 Tax=Prunus dulcis TaxID=3755 RepID=A0AAD4WIN1_PRUDU|nr:hypothetical protein L3X38_011717 [Prunus dulcis]